MTRSILLHSSHSQKARLTGWLFLHWDASVVVGLIKEDDDGHEAEAGLNCINPERPVPRESCDDERSKQGTKVWGYGDKG